MTVTVTSFRQNLQEFNDPQVYSSSSVTYLIALAATFQNAARWDPLTIDYGTGLFVAHYLVLEARAVATVAAGGIPGTVEGIRTAKSVDKVAISYDAQSVALEGAAFWNMTTYGIRFYQLTRAYGSGGAQLGLPTDSAPFYWPGFV